MLNASSTFVIFQFVLSALLTLRLCFLKQPLVCPWNSFHKLFENMQRLFGEDLWNVNIHLDNCFLNFQFGWRNNVPLLLAIKFYIEVAHKHSYRCSLNFLYVMSVTWWRCQTSNMCSIFLGNLPKIRFVYLKIVHMDISVNCVFIWSLIRIYFLSFIHIVGSNV